MTAMPKRRVVTSEAPPPSSLAIDFFSEDSRAAVAQRVRAVALATVPPQVAGELIDDALQETFRRLMEKPRSQQTFPIAVGIARNVFREMFRRRGQNRLFDPSVCDLIAEEVSARPFEAMSRDIHDCIEQLPAGQRTAIVERYFEENSVSQIASMEGCTSSAISDRLRNAFRKLHACLTRRGITNPSGG